MLDARDIRPRTRRPRICSRLGWRRALPGPSENRSFPRSDQGRTRAFREGPSRHPSLEPAPASDPIQRYVSERPSTSRSSHSLAPSSRRPNTLRTCRSRCGNGISRPCARQRRLQRPRVGRLHGARALDRRASAEPHDELEVQAAVAETDQPDLRRAPVGSHIVMRHFARGFEPGLAHQLLVAAVGHAEGHAHAPVHVAQRPVGDAAGDELRVRHEDVDVVVGGDRACCGC